MASVQKTASGYRVQVAVRGQRDSRVFRTRREADAWAAQRETELRTMADASPSQRHTLGDMLARYRDEVSVTKRGQRWEIIRINRFLAGWPNLCARRLCEITPELMARWRDDRSRQVSSGSVLREMGQIGAAFETARREWRWIDHNPIGDVRRPRTPDHREVVISRRQMRGMLRALGYRPGHPVREQRHAVAVCFLVALRTGMRAGELCGLTWDCVFEDYAVLPVTKTKPRRVPLPPKSRALIERMRGWDERLVFGLGVSSLDALFRKYRARAGLSGFTFHDARHTAATWLARRVDVLDLCKAFGWADPKRAMIYYNPTASDIAVRMSGRAR